MSDSRRSSEVPEHSDVGRVVSGVERRRRKARIQQTWVVVWSVAALAALVYVPFSPPSWPDRNRGLVVGFAVGLLAVAAAMGASVWRARRGYDNPTTRVLSGRDDERDRLIDLRSWRLTGMVAYVAMIVSTLVALLDGPVKVVAAVGMLVMIAVQLGSKAFYLRTM